MKKIFILLVLLSLVSLCFGFINSSEKIINKLDIFSNYSEPIFFDNNHINTIYILDANGLKKDNYDFYNYLYEEALINIDNCGFLREKSDPEEDLLFFIAITTNDEIFYNITFSKVRFMPQYVKVMGSTKEGYDKYSKYTEDGVQAYVNKDFKHCFSFIGEKTEVLPYYNPVIDSEKKYTIEIKYDLDFWELKDTTGFILTNIEGS